MKNQYLQENALLIDVKVPTNAVLTTTTAATACLSNSEVGLKPTSIVVAL